ncbi:MAG TPA: multifunctional oxoglutarate decarboxylase/oxoglutarate dehydrogenase thiamine pyrophosphate-binding subunit/dihydrolipoyllysine-residue succinyltransferase subunit [Galbitalea sp.]
MTSTVTVDSNHSQPNEVSLTAPLGHDGPPTAQPMRGVAKAIATNMDLSLQVPTATSVRSVPAKLLSDNRIVINNHLHRTIGGKVTYSHLIGWSLVRAVASQPGMNCHYTVLDGKPALVTPAHVNLGIAVDTVRADGSRTLLLPTIQAAEQLGFRDFVSTFDGLVARALNGSITAADMSGATITLTNPGAAGTKQSVPRLMVGQGAVIGVGALEHPAAHSGSAPRTLADLGIGPVVTMTSTYDHRIIQGAVSGEFLGHLHALLNGADGFYEDIFAALGIPYVPIQSAIDIAPDEYSEISKQTRVHALIEAFRARGHLMADTNPVGYEQRTHPDLELATHGLTLWDLERDHLAGDLGGAERPVMPLRDILGILRDAYCRTTGVEYMHIADPAQRSWFQSRLERPYDKPARAEQLRVLNKLNEAEAFETFLQTKYVGQTRFSLEGSESLIALLDELMRQAAEQQLDGATIAMAHRGRLNVLTNIAGKRYSTLFQEFDGTSLPDGSGDVKYHLGTNGSYTSECGYKLPVYLAANPSHLDAVDAVSMGITRARQDRNETRAYATLPIIIHGDAAMAGQGVVSETMQMSKLAAYDIGGTVRINVNNQIGFTTLPSDARTSTYSTDVVKSIQVPVLHVNGDDPEAVVRAARIAFEYRQEFQRDVVIDLVSYRRRGHNEADDPSMTQPRMYGLIDAKPSVRSLYLDSLLGRGDVSRHEYEEAHEAFYALLEASLAEARDAEAEPTDLRRDSLMPVVPPPAPPTPRELQKIGEMLTTPPESFAPHARVAKLLEKRREMSVSGNIDWATGELLALGSVASRGTSVRLIGQDTGRGTFAQRHALVYDQATGARWSALEAVARSGAHANVHDSILSEYAAMAFEYGYSVESPRTLVLWEAQFGDFVNGAQIVVDEFLCSAEQKWGQANALVLLLPHGYEGQGPDHSSARIERFLQLCAEDNMVLAQPTTPASYFHLLREQAYRSSPKPLVVFTPKSMLRARTATSEVQDLTGGRFRPVLDDPNVTGPDKVARVLVVSGKVYYDLRARLDALEPGQRERFALVRIERLFPAPLDELSAALGRYPNAESVWLQEEPRNQGAWTYIATEVGPSLGHLGRVIARRSSAAPATGSPRRHATEGSAILDEAFAI